MLTRTDSSIHSIQAQILEYEFSFVKSRIRNWDGLTLRINPICSAGADSRFFSLIWYTLVLAIGGLLTIGSMIGYILAILSAMVLIYRVFRGWSQWNINAPIEQSIV